MKTHIAREDTGLYCGRELSETLIYISEGEVNYDLLAYDKDACDICKRKCLATKMGYTTNENSMLTAECN